MLWKGFDWAREGKGERCADIKKGHDFENLYNADTKEWFTVTIRGFESSRYGNLVGKPLSRIEVEAGREKA